MHYALSMRRLCAACGATGPSGGMADAEVSKTSDFGRVSSSLTSGTTFFKASGAYVTFGSDVFKPAAFTMRATPARIPTMLRFPRRGSRLPKGTMRPVGWRTC